MSPWGIPRVESGGKNFEIQVSRLLEKAFPTIIFWLQKHSLYIVDKHDFLSVNFNWKYLHSVMFADVFLSAAAAIFVWILEF